MTVLNIIRDCLDALLHPSARYDVLTRARHRAFIALRVLGSLAALAAFPVYIALRGARWRRGRMRWRMLRDHTASLVETFDVRAARPGVAARTLSGGNQQKLVLARELDAASAWPRILHRVFTARARICTRP